MADIVLDAQGPPATPAAGQAVIYVDSLTKHVKVRPDTGLEATLGALYNFSTANQTGFATDQYLNGSPILLPGSLARAGTMYRFRFDMSKTAAGVAGPVINVRFGTAGTTADAARLTFTFGAGSAAVDTGIWEVVCHFRNVGAAAVMTGYAKIEHLLAATGLTNTGASGDGIIRAISAAFDSTVPNSIIGVSFNGGAAFVGTNQLQQAELLNV